MALEFAHGAIQWLAADAAGATYTVSGLSFQPKALRFYWQGLQSAVDAASQATFQRRGVGFAAGTTSRACAATQSQDAAATMVCTSAWSASAVAITLTSTPAIDGALDLDAITSDGFRLIVDDQVPANITIFWEAWGGSDIAAASAIAFAERNGAGTSLHAHGVGGTPSVLMFASVNGVTNNVAIRDDSGLSVGFATGTADAENVVVAGNNDDGSAAADTDGYGRAGDCIAMFTTAGGNPSARAKVTNLAASGTQFELTWASGTATGRGTVGLAIRGGRWNAGGLTINGNTGSATSTVSGLSYQPKGISLIGRMVAQDAAGTATAQDRIGLGSGSSTSSRRAMGTWDEDGTAATEIDHVIEYDQVLAYPSAAGALAAALDINAINSDGFQLIVDTAGGVASEWVGYLTFGNAGTQFTQSVSGTLTTAGALLKQARKSVSGTVTTAGAMLKQAARSLTGTLTSAGAVLKRAGKTLAATLTTSGALTASHTFNLALTGTLTSAGTLVRETRKVLAGVLSSSGAIVKQIARAGLAATLTTIGTLTKQTARTLAATLTTAATVTRQAQKLLAGVLSSSGAIVKQTARAGLAGTVTTIGTLTRQTSRTLAGTLTTAGTLTRQAQKVLAGVMSSSGAIVKQTARALAAALTSAGSLATQLITGAQTFFQSVAGTLTTAGALSRQTAKSTSGTVTTAGAVTRQARKVLAGVVSSSGAIVKQTARLLAGTLTTAGTLSRQARKVLAGALTSAGALVGELVIAGQTYLQSVTATLASAGALTRYTATHTSGSLSTAGALSRMTARGLASTLALTGSLVKQTARALSSVLSFVATLLERLFGPPPPATPHVRVMVRPDVSRVIVAREPRRVMVAADVSRVMVAGDVRTIIARPDVDEVL